MVDLAVVSPQAHAVDMIQAVKPLVRALQVIEPFKHDVFSCASDSYITVIQARFRPNRRRNVPPDYDGSFVHWAN